MAKLRCRVGDIVVVIARNGNRGKFGTVERATDQTERAMFPRDNLHWYVTALGSKFSVCNADESIKWEAGHFLACDSELLPLRDQPGQDEILRITGKPKKPARPAARRKAGNHSTEKVIV